MYRQKLITTVLLLLQTVSCSIYYVRQDNQSAFDTTITLNNLFRVSDTQVRLFHGTYYINNRIMIKEVHNITLAGIISDDSAGTIIQCSLIGGIIISDSSYINISGIVFENCQTSWHLQIKTLIIGYINSMRISSASLLVINSYTVSIQHIVVFRMHAYNVVLINAFAQSTLNEITAEGIAILYKGYSVNFTNCTHNLIVSNYHPFYSSYSLKYFYEIALYLVEHLYHVNITISNVSFQTEKALYYRSVCSSGYSSVILTMCNFSNIKFLVDENKSIVSVIINETFCKHVAAIKFIKFIKCLFVNNKNNGSEVQKYMIRLESELEKTGTELQIVKCIFYRFQNLIALYLKGSLYSVDASAIPLLFVENTAFLEIIKTDTVLYLFQTNLEINGPVLFSKISAVTIISNVKAKTVFHNYVEISNSHVAEIVQSRIVYFKANTTINITSNIVVYSIFQTDNLEKDQFYPPCLLQYINIDPILSNLDDFIVIANNSFKKFCGYKYCMSHCSWTQSILYTVFNPLDVNKRAIFFVNESETKTLFYKKHICYCTNGLHHDCFIDQITDVYPGQTLQLYLINTLGTDIRITINTVLPTSCRVTKNSEMKQVIFSSCTRINYTIYHNKKWCELFISSTKHPQIITEAFYITLLDCPLGFTLHQMEGYCHCDPILSSTPIISVTSCNINNQTILRPPNSWISVDGENNSYLYLIALQCPFDYCLPHSSHLNLSNSDSQCQFDRTGLLCGRCKEGLSAVFGTSQCKYCINHFLFIIIPVLIVGALLVVVMFTANLTVTDGTINGFIFYVNVLSINSPVFLKHHTITYVLVSLANLDLGIETCFYNGMDDYAKMWLQLSFPIYLIFIATLLIITSRYSTRIQRLTARRALPVLATLFLLSYTKILRTVSSVLFSYSTINILPNRKAITVWSIDANIQLFGIKFMGIFIICILLFLILAPFNVVLIFTKILFRFKLVSYFKPLLDAYQGPYKSQYYYWPGLQLSVRAVFFAISTLDKNINLTIGIVLLAAIEAFHGYLHPFKNAFKNVQELFIIFHLIIVFTFSLYQNANSIIINVSVAVTVIHFSILLLHHFLLFQCKFLLKTIFANNSFITKISKATGKRINNLWKKAVQHTQRRVHSTPLNIAIPDVTYRYDKFRESLLGEDS